MSEVEVGEFSGLHRRTVSFACGGFGCAVRVEGPTRSDVRRMHAITERVREALGFAGLTLEEFLLLAEFCRTFDVMDLTFETLDAALEKLARFESTETPT